MIAYVIMKNMENLRFDKKGYFHVLVFDFSMSNSIKEIENNFSRIPTRYRNTRGNFHQHAVIIYDTKAM